MAESWPDGTPVQVRNRFERSWVSGFEIAGPPVISGSPEYRVRRRSDQAVLPASFSPSDVRADRPQTMPVPVRPGPRQRRP